MTWRIGVDAGGTFTDVCLFDDSAGRVVVRKVLSTPDDPSRGIALGIEEAIARTGAEDAEAMARLPVRATPGPSAGVVGAQEVARLAGFDALVSFDMGGTSTHVALLPAGAPADPVTPAGPDIHSVRAGGGSLASVGSDGALQVGPDSADPGPACYGSGTAGPTVTDAHLVLGTLNPDTMLGGRLQLRQDFSAAAIGALAGQLGVDVPAAAQAIVAAVTVPVAAAIRAISAQRGQRLGDHTLVAFGGSGPLHAARLARELGIARILVPRHPGILGAIGQLLTEPRADFSAAGPMDFGADALPVIAEAFGLLRHRAAMWFSREKIPAAARRITRRVDMRYAGQEWSVSVPVPDGAVTAATLDALAAAFAAACRHTHGVIAGGGKPQFVAFHVEAVGLLPRPGFQPRAEAGADAAAARTGSRAVWLPEAGGWVICPVYDRDRLDAGNSFMGPAIVEQMDTTTLILPGMTARVEPYLSLVLDADA